MSDQHNEGKISIEIDCLGVKVKVTSEGESTSRFQAASENNALAKSVFINLKKTIDLVFYMPVSILQLAANIFDLLSDGLTKRPLSSNAQDYCKMPNYSEDKALTNAEENPHVVEH